MPKCEMCGDDLEVFDHGRPARICKKRPCQLMRFRLNNLRRKQKAAGMSGYMSTQVSKRMIAGVSHHAEVGESKSLITLLVEDGWLNFRRA